MTAEQIKPRNNNGNGSFNELPLDEPAGSGMPPGHCLAFRMSLRIILLLVAILLLGLLYLSFWGLPSSVVRRVEQRIEQYGHHVRIRAIRVNILDGIVADEVRSYSAADSRCPVFEAERAALRFNLFDWLRRKPGLKGIRIRGGLVRTRLDGGMAAVVDSNSPENITVRNICADVRIEERAWQVVHFAADVLGVLVEGRGYVVRPEKPLEKPFFKSWADLFRREGGQGPPEWAPLLVKELNAIGFSRNADAILEFVLHPCDLDANEIVLSAGGGAASARGVHFDRWQIEAQLRKGIVQIPTVLLHRDKEELRGSGALDFRTQTVEARGFSSLNPDAWWRLIPRKWQARAESKGMTPNGFLDVSLTVGPVLHNEVGRHIRGWISLAEVDMCGVWVEEARISFTRTNEVLTLESVEAVLGREAQQGGFDGTAVVQLDTGEFSGHAQTSFDPNAAISVLSSNQARIVGALEFPETPPSTDIHFTGDITEPWRFGVQGRFSGTNLSFRGATMKSFAADVTFSNHVLALSNLKVAREEGRLAGDVTIDFEHSTVDLDVESTLAPPAIARIIGPTVERFLSRFRFEGRTHISAKGNMDYNERQQMNIRASVNAQDLGFKWWTAEHCSFEFTGKGDRFVISDMEGVVYGGQFAGQGVCYPEGSITNLAYELTGNVTNANFADLMENVVEDDENHYQGKVDVAITLAGLIGKGQGNTAVGEGSFVVRDGHVRQVPLLGGLTEFLCRLHPGLGALVFTDCRVDYEVRDALVHTDLATLEGNVLRITASGDYHFDQKLDFDATVRFLRESKVAAVIDVITFPLKLILDFHLGGHLATPKWRPRNLPKELFLKFD